MLPNVSVLNFIFNKCASYQQTDGNNPQKAKVGVRIPHRDLSVGTASEMQIRSDQRDHQRVAPAPSLSGKHASRHICKQLTGPFPATLLLRVLEGWHAEADLIVPRLSLNLHVRCQLPCHRRSIHPPHRPDTKHGACMRLKL